MAGNWSRPRLLAGSVALALALVSGYYFLAAAVGRTPPAGGGLRLGDFEVYRAAVRSWLDGSGLYTGTAPGGDWTSELLFTYPPFAAIVLAPLVPLSAPVASWLWFLASLAVYPVLAVLLMRQAPGARRTPQPTSVLVCGLISIGLLLSQPASHGLFVGQVSGFVVLAALVDAAGVIPRRWRGFLVGLAAAVKLLPLVFVPYFLFTRQWRAARNSLIGFFAATLLGFAVMPHESVRYWTALVFDSSRVGEVQLSRNKSLLGLLHRWGLDGEAWLWLTLALAIALVAFWRAGRHHARGEGFAAALIVGTLSIVVSPISWPHHQVWVPLVAMYLLLLLRPWPVVAGSLLLAGYWFYTPLISWEETGPLWLRLAWEIPALVPVAIALLGLPQKVTRPVGEPVAEPAAG